MKKTLVAMLLSSALSLMPLPSAADEAEAKRQLETVATGLVASLPTGKKVVLKTISPEQSGLPEDFLGKLTSDLEAALLVASEFEIDLINRQTTEEIWAEAIEFNNAEFDALHAASGADVALMLDARATEAGVEIALTAYSLNAADAGKVLASSGSTVLALDMQQNVGVDVNSLNDQMAQVLAEVEKVGQTGGLISDPNTYAEYYHNARILQQRGENDQALASFEAAIKMESRFVDPMLTLIDLAQARYGKQGSRKYFEAKIFPFISEDARKYLELHLSEDPSEFLHYIIHGDIQYLPFLADWFWMHGVQLKSERTSAGSKLRGYDYAILKSARALVYGMESGRLQKYFLDQVEASRRYRVSDARSIIREINRVEYALFERDYTLTSSTPAYLKRSECLLTPRASPFAGENIPSLDFSEVSSRISEVQKDCRFRPELDFFSSPNPSFGIEDAQIIYSFPGSNQGLDNLKIVSDPESGGPCFTSVEDVAGLNRESSGFDRLDFGRPAVSSLFSETTFDPRIAISSHELHPAFDRIIFADLCAAANSPSTNPGGYISLPSSRIGMTTRVRGIAGLLITDEVDYSEPIKVYVDLIGHDGSDPVWTDISRDGTYFSERGAPLGGLIGPYAYQYEGGRNSWLFAPGIVQSLLYKDRIVKVEYTNAFGELVEVDKVVSIDLNTINADYDWVSDGDGKGRYIAPSEDFLAAAWERDFKFWNGDVEAASREMSWVAHQDYPAVVHLGDEQIDGWPPVDGACMVISFDDVPAGGKSGLTYQPYGVENLFLVLPDGVRFDLPRQQPTGGKRPNFWGEELSFSLNAPSGANAMLVQICSGVLTEGDVDDLMLRNVRTWTFK